MFAKTNFTEYKLPYFFWRHRKMACQHQARRDSASPVGLCPPEASAHLLRCYSLPLTGPQRLAELIAASLTNIVSLLWL